jgi:Glycosyl transferases group 1
MSSSVHRAIVVSTEVYLRPLEGIGGGVQWCTQEYFATFKEANIDWRNVSYSPPRNLFALAVRKLARVPFQGFHHPRLTSNVVHAAQESGTRWVFLNNTDAAPLAIPLKSTDPRLKIVFLSHGAEITDVVNNLRLAPEVAHANWRNSRWLGELLKLEIRIRSAIDATVCISKEDVDFEKWLGTRNVLFLPRQIPWNPIAIKPVPGRLGTVATLNHGPNLHGLRLLAKALHGDTQLRLIGSPDSIGRQLESEFNSIRYLGHLSDHEMRSEAATWCGFVNPIFCHARGASTKVATALGWGLPVLTTPPGARGYRWNETSLPLPETPQALAELCDRVASATCLTEWQQRAHDIVRLGPTVAESASQLNNFLKNLLS